MNPQQQHEYDDAVQKGHGLFIDNYPIDNQKVIDVYNALKKKRPELVVAGVSRQSRLISGTTCEHYAAYRGVDLAYANLPSQVVGTIGFEHDQYFVTCRLIRNAKFSQWSGRDHHTKKSKHMNNIVKDAVKVLLPTQFHEVIEESLRLYQHKIGSIRDKAVHGMRSALNGTSTALRDELFNMVATGYKPKNASFASAMAYVVETKEEYERNQNYNPDRVFVWVKPDCVVYGDCEEKAQSIATMEELPEHIRGKLFVLMVADKEVFIDDVGMKVSDNKFWVIL